MSTTIPDVVYGRKFGMAITMNIVKPEKPTGVGIVALASGGWRSLPDVGNPQTEEFLKRGITVFLTTHGGRPKFSIHEIIGDIRRAVRFARMHAAEYGVDPERIGLFGISSGGNISLLTAAQAGPGNPEAADPLERESDRVGAVACFYPPTDLRNFGEPGKIWIPYRTGEEPEDDAGLAEAWSPVAKFTKEMPPVLIIHGDKDALVPVQQGYAAERRLKELGVEHRLVVKPGKDHGWPDSAEDRELCAEWFVRYLGR